MGARLVLLVQLQDQGIQPGHICPLGLFVFVAQPEELGPYLVRGAGGKVQLLDLLPVLAMLLHGLQQLLLFVHAPLRVRGGLFELVRVLRPQLCLRAVGELNLHHCPVYFAGRCPVCLCTLH